MNLKLYFSARSSTFVQFMKNKLSKEMMKKALTLILFLSLSIFSFAQNITVKGKVVDTDNEPIVAASVVVAGTQTGTSTDIDGNFTINVASGKTLTISMIGYKTANVTVGKNADIRVVLEADVEFLEDVVVVGYGTQKKKLVTGSTLQVKGDDIAKLSTTNVMSALQSQSPGVNIVQNNGFLQSGFKVNIRGFGTTGDSAPLVVVDGVAGGSLDGLNPSDIERVDVLKDAASAAIYGTRAANGVILVTTKQGREGKFEVSYDGYFGVQNIYKLPTVLTAQEYMAIQDEARVMDGLEPNKWETYLPAADLKAINDGTWTGTNWLKEILNKNASVHNHAVNVTGGNSMSTFALGFAYTGQDATMGVPTAVPHMDRYNFRVNSKHVIFKKNDLNILTVGETINYRFSQTKGSFGTGGIYWNGVHNMLVMSPLMRAYNSEGNYYVLADQKANGYNWDTANSSSKNPIAYLDYYMNQNVSKSHYLQSSVFAELQPIKDLKLKSQFGYMMNGSSSRSYIPVHQLTEGVAYAYDQVSQSESLYNRWTWENTISYSGKVEDHSFDATIGHSMEQYSMGESLSATNQNSNFNDLKHAYLSNVSSVSGSATMSGSPAQVYKLLSFFGRANYNYKEKYMATVILRADASSVFARGHRWGFFPSVSAGWVMSNEDFFNVNAIDFLKIRASWGQNGNCSVSGFQWLSLITSNAGYGGYSFGDKALKSDISTGSYAYRLTNPDLSWETSEQINIGLDARFFNNRLSLEADWYRKTTKDWLVTAPVLYSYGASAASVNGGDVLNTGFEVGLHWNESIGKDLYYDFNVSTAHNVNRVTKIANADGIIHGTTSVPWEGAEELFRAEVGYPMGYFYGYKTAGIFQNQKEIDAYTGAKINGDKTQPGDVIYVDTNKDGVIDEKDRTMLGSPHPDWTIGFSFDFGWKMLDIAVTTYAALGQEIFKCYRDFSSSPLNNFTTDIYQRWTGEGSSNKFPRLSSASSNNWNKISDLYIENGNYWKIQNITLGCDFKKIFKNIPLGQLRLFVTGQNLFTVTKYSGMDPEIGYGGDGEYAWAQGIDLGYYPSARTIMVGLNLKF